MEEGSVEKVSKSNRKEIQLKLHQFCKRSAIERRFG